MLVFAMISRVWNINKKGNIDAIQRFYHRNVWLQIDLLGLLDKKEKAT